MNKNYKRANLILVIGFFVFTIVGYNIFFRKDKDKIIKTDEPTEGLVDVIVSEEKAYKGKVSGKICYPSELVPEGDLLIKNTKTKEILKEHFDETKVGQQQNFLITLDEGVYVFAYKPVTNDIYGFFTPCALTMEANDCSTKESHQLTEIKVEKDKTTKGVTICDYYYSTDDKPNFSEN